MPSLRRTAPSCLVAVVLLAAGRLAAAPSAQETADVRRALTLLNVVGEEYREGVVGGEVVLPIEYEEAKTFLDEAQGRLRGVAPAAASATEAGFAAARTLLLDKGPLETLRAELDGLRVAISERTGIAEEVFPPAAPSAVRGQALFSENCAPCHGEHANGAGPEAARLDPKPANFTDPEFMQRETPFDFFNILTVGKRQSAMPAWGEVLSLQDRWDLVSFVWSVHAPPATLNEGQGVYLSACAGCHGAAGDGQGIYSDGLRTPVAALDIPASLARRSDAEVLRIVADGVAGTAMPGFAGRLSEVQMRAAVAYVRGLSLGAGEAVAGAATGAVDLRRVAGLLRLVAAEYAKAVPPQAPVDERELVESEILLGQVERQLPRVEAVLAAHDAASAARFSADVAALTGAVRARQPARDVLVQAGGAAELLERQAPAATAGSATAQQDGLAEARRLLDQALTAYRDGNPRAVYLVSDAYFLFDPLEKQLALVDAELARRTEGRFAELRGVMSAPGHASEAAAIVGAIDADLDRCVVALAPRTASRANLAFQSAFIILREGFEVVLVVGALLAYVGRIGARSMRAPILWGAVAGMAASLLTAYALLQFVQATGATAEVLEGATMLLASAVLFFVSYWLISKAEADRWQRYIQGKVQSAVAAGNLLALAGAAFLAVYREGVETVLFYRALVGSAGEDLGAVVGGFAVGAALLAVVYVLYVRLGKRLPMRQFFLVTGGLLYYLAVVFAGKGVAELQGAGWLPTTPVAWVPRVDLIGLYPTLETLAAQGVLIACVVFAVIVTLRRNRSERVAQSAEVGVASPGGAKL